MGLGPGYAPADGIDRARPTRVASARRRRRAHSAPRRDHRTERLADHQRTRKAIRRSRVIGSFVQVGWKVAGPHTGGGKRGEITSFSPDSGRRLAERLAGWIPNLQIDGFRFLTVTVPGGDRDDTCDRELFRRFRQELFRMGATGVWLMERQTRDALHLHALLWMKPHQWDQVNPLDTWKRICPGISPEAQRLEKPRSTTAVLTYLAGETLKKAQRTRAVGGRFWGVIGRDRMELVPTYETDDLDLADRLLRMVADTWAHIHARAGRFAQAASCLLHAPTKSWAIVPDEPPWSEWDTRLIGPGTAQVGPCFYQLDSSTGLIHAL